MTGYEVITGELHAAGSAVQELSERAGGLTPGNTLAAGASAVPGAVSAEALVKVADRWLLEVADWRSRAGQYAARLQGSASTYEQADSSSAGGFSHTFRAS